MNNESAIRLVMAVCIPLMTSVTITGSPVPLTEEDRSIVADDYTIPTNIAQIRVVGELLPYIADGDMLLSAPAIRRIGEIGTKAEIPLLYTLLTNDCYIPGVCALGPIVKRREILHALGQIGGSEACDILLGVFSNAWYNRPTEDDWCDGIYFSPVRYSCDSLLTMASEPSVTATFASVIKDPMYTNSEFFVAGPMDLSFGIRATFLTPVRPLRPAA